MDQPRRCEDDRTGALMVGVTIMLIGVTLMLDRAGVIDGIHYTVFIGLLILATGLVKLSHPREDGPRRGGWWVFVGLLLVLNETGVWRFHDSWPLWIVAAGVSMVWKERSGVA